uniref:Hexosyltransferase n=1 Tax=Panagrolaimus davidi TaxID=227884 RepID=A0A914PKR5_9BILA
MRIRNSWKRDVPTTFTHRFFVGLTQNETMQEMNENEAEKYVFTNIIDSDLNQTLQMSAIFQWQQKFFPKVDYFLKVDETSILDVSRFQYWLNLKFNMFKTSYIDSIIFGNLLQNDKVVRDPNEKRYVPYDIYDKPNFPSYQHGSCYLTTPNTIKLMLEEAKNHKYISFDDAFFTGIIAEKVKATRINANRHFASQNPIATNSWDQECDDNGVPFLFSISDENGEIVNKADGYKNALKNLKELKCSSEN